LSECALCARGWVMSWLGGAKSSLGDAKSLLGDV
jgi:hypothetical protein